MGCSYGAEGEEHMSNDDVIAELERENQMLRARNERLEKENTWLEAALANAQIQLLNKVNESNH